MSGRGWSSLALAAAIPFLLWQAPGLEPRLETAARVEGAESAEVDAALATRFHSPFTRSVVLVAQALPMLHGPQGRAALRNVLASVSATPGVTRTYSYLDAGEPGFLSADGTGTYAFVGLDPARPPEPIVAALRARLRDARVPGARLEVTAGPALNADLRAASRDQIRRAEKAAAPLVLLLLLLAFRAPVAAALPLLSGGLAVGLALGAAALAARVMRLSLALTSTVSMLGMGLSVDHALLMVHRFRELRCAGLGSADAARGAGREAGGTVLLSGGAVAVGFGVLAASPLDDLRSIGVGGLLATTTSVLLATIALPVVLERLGPRLDWGRSSGARQRPAEFWRRWAWLVNERPLAILAVSALPLAALALQARHFRPGLPQADWLPRDAPAVRALAGLRAMGKGGIAFELRALVCLPDEVTALSREGYEATRRVAAVLAADPRIEEVRWIGNVGGVSRDLASASLVPYPVKRAFVADEADAALVTAIPRGDVDPNALVALVSDLRRRDPAALTGLPGVRLLWGGLPALSADYEQAVMERLPRGLAWVLAGAALLLLVGLRAPILALKAVALNLLTVTAAMGVVVVVFQDGLLAPFAVEAPLVRLFPALPALVFGSVFGLSLDYEVFLLARLREKRASGTREALTHALERTGGLITGAAAIMAAVFGAFASSGFLLVRVLGTALAAAVVLDATIVRLALGPALVALAGRWNWWPLEATALPPSPRLPRPLPHL